jgi:hypothetical protein
VRQSLDKAVVPASCWVSVPSHGRSGTIPARSGDVLSLDDGTIHQIGDGGVSHGDRTVTVDLLRVAAGLKDRDRRNPDVSHSRRPGWGGPVPLAVLIQTGLTSLSGAPGAQEGRKSTRNDH